MIISLIRLDVVVSHHCKSSKQSITLRSNPTTTPSNVESKYTNRQWDMLASGLLGKELLRPEESMAGISCLKLGINSDNDTKLDKSKASNIAIPARTEYSLSASTFPSFIEMRLLTNVSNKEDNISFDSYSKPLLNLICNTIHPIFSR